MEFPTLLAQPNFLSALRVVDSSPYFFWSLEVFFSQIEIDQDGGGVSDPPRGGGGGF